MMLLGLLVLGLHIAMRLVAPDADPFILPIIVVLNGLGIAEIYRIDLADKLEGWENGGIRQIGWTAISIVIAILVLVFVRNHRVLQRYRFVGDVQRHRAAGPADAAGDRQRPRHVGQAVDRDRAVLVPAG